MFNQQIQQPASNTSIPSQNNIQIQQQQVQQTQQQQVQQQQQQVQQQQQQVQQQQVQKVQQVQSGVGYESYMGPMTMLLNQQMSTPYNQVVLAPSH